MQNVILGSCLHERDESLGSEEGSSLKVGDTMQAKVKYLNEVRCMV